MSDLQLYFYIFEKLILIIVIVGILFLFRCKAFNRYEAMTFETSLVAVVVSAIYLSFNMRSLDAWIMVAVSIACFVLISMRQKHYLEVLQKKINEYDNSEEYYVDYMEEYKAQALKGDQTNGKTDGEDIKTAEGILDKEVEEYMKKYMNFRKNLFDFFSKTIAPSFSRFIEESSLFTKPAGFLSLIKVTMDTKKFQKRKYMLREKAAHLCNLCGPYISSDEKIKRFDANDFALDDSDEKDGLLAFDVLGFIPIPVIFYWVCLHQNAGEIINNVIPGSVVLLSILFAIVVAILDIILRKNAFGGGVSYPFECVYSVLLFLIIDMILGVKIPYYKFIVGAMVAVYLGAAIAHWRIKKKAKEEIDSIIKKYKNQQGDCNKEMKAVRKEFIESFRYIAEASYKPVLTLFKGKYVDEDYMKQIEAILEDII